MKRILSYVLTVIMVSALLISVVNAADRFSDISEHWAKDEINYLAQKSILGGYEDGSFRPNGTVTRAEFIKMMTETFGLTEIKSPYYSDVSTSDWFYQYIAKATAQGFILSYGNSMSPNGELTREEAAALLVRYLKLSDAVTSSYPDYSSISSQYATYVLQATHAGLFAGYEDGTFRPKNTLTRAEALTILYRAAGQIYTSSTSGNDVENLQNAVISRGITISDAYLEGNVYITEGTSGEKVVLNGVNINGTLFIRSSADITLTNCTITNVVVESGMSQSATLKVYGTRQHIYNLSVGSPANIVFDSSAKISEISILEDARGTKITGTGTIASLKIYTSGVTSEIVPANNTIESPYTAVFGGVEYTRDGPVAVGTGFASGYPYAEETNDGYITLTHKTEKTGTIYYIAVLKRSATPDAKSIQSDGYSFDVTRVRENEDELRLKYTKFDDNDLAVVFVDENGNAYEPVRVFSEESSGFYTSSVKASSSGSTYTATYTLNSFSAGKAYIVAYRPEDITAPDDAKIVSYAEGKTSSSRYVVGAVLDMPKAGTTYTQSIELPSSYSTYEWETAVIFETSEGIKLATSYAEISAYKEDLTAKKPIEGNGFINEPVIELNQYSYPQITSLYDVISFKTKEDGRVYYYYTKTSTAPKAEDFYTNYRSATYSDYINVTGERAVNDQELDYTKTTVSTYTHIVFSFCDSDGNYYEPVVVSRSTATTSSGFSSTPTFTASGGTEYAICTPLSSGTVYYYYTSSSTTPSVSDYTAYYNGTTYRGSQSVSASSTSVTLKNTSDVSSVYSHVVLMFRDSYGNSYQPVVVKRTTTGSTGSDGFTVDPSVYILDTGYDYIMGTASESGTLVYYYTNSSTTPTSSAFLSNLTGIYGTQVVSATVAFGFQSNTTSGSGYSYIAIMLIGSSGTYYNPIVVARP